VSIFTYSRMRYVVMQAVAELEKQGYNPEVSAQVLGSGFRIIVYSTLAQRWVKPWGPSSRACDCLTTGCCLVLLAPLQPLTACGTVAHRHLSQATSCVT
jgi:hypothetical protein